jgi:LPS-assembly protein
MRRGTALCIAALLAVAPLREAAAAGGAPQPPVLFRADEVQYDQDLGLVVLKGNVELDQQEQVLLADTVTYNERTDTANASGHVSLLQPTGEVIFADFLELHDHMRDGFVQNIRMLLSDRSRLAGNTARRVEGNRTEIRRGVYSACEPCEKDPTRAPIWQIKGETVIHDKELQLVEYRDAVMEIDGFPVFWTPYLSHPDPSVKRRSGFLFPSFGSSPSLGFHTGIPYYWVISQDKDATITPMITTGGGEFLGGQYRERFANGYVHTDASITVDSQRFTAIDTTPVNGPRWHIASEGEIDLNQEWRLRENIMRASDPTYLLRYRLPSPYNFLTTHVYAEDFGRSSYANISGWSFQSLQTGVGDSTQPIVLPVADYQWTSQPSPIGGRFSAEGNLMDLYRIQGIATRRGSLGGEWRVPLQGAIGDQYALTVGLRGDGYQSDNLPIAATNGATTQSAFASRAFPQVALTWHYPWVRQTERYSQLIEPIAMVAAAPVGGNPSTIPNEDSQGFELDETSLFLRNRFQGFDRVDGGQRVDYGLRAGIYGASGGSTRLLVGQSYALQTNNTFVAGSGLNHHLSDVVGRVTVSPFPALDFTYRFRLEHDDLAMRRQEVAAVLGPAALRLSLSYIQIEATPNAPNLAKTKEVSAVLQTKLTRYWSVQLQGVRVFASAAPTTIGQAVGTTETLYSGAAVTYRDECVAFVGSIQQSGIRSGDVLPGTSVLFTIVFKNIGDVATTVANF